MADILIRGIEMPSKGCLRCPFNLYYANAVYCNCMIIKLLGKPSEAKYQNEVNCPLHELPEHGDLIDLDERLTGIIYDEHNNDTDMVTMTAREWLGSVDDIPTVIVPSNKEDVE